MSILPSQILAILGMEPDEGIFADSEILHVLSGA